MYIGYVQLYIHFVMGYNSLSYIALDWIQHLLALFSKLYIIIMYIIIMYIHVLIRVMCVVRHVHNLRLSGVNVAVCKVCPWLCFISNLNLSHLPLPTTLSAYICQSCLSA